MLLQRRKRQSTAVNVGSYFPTKTWLLFAVNSDRGLVCAICSLARELRGTNDSCFTDGSKRVCELKRTMGALRFNPALSHGPDEDWDQEACQGRLIHSENKLVYMLGYLHTEAYAACTSKKSSVQMVFVENHMQHLLSRVNACWHWLSGCKAQYN